MRYTTALLATTLPLLAAGEAQLLPAGSFAARDGRPTDTGVWTLTDAAGAALATRINAVAKATPIVIDYEHQTMLASGNGHPAPAAGWIKSASWRDGVGLFGEVDWTPRAQGFIDAGEYRFISPVIESDDAGNVTALHNAALVNFPALLGMNPVVARLAAQFSSSTPEPDMALLATLITALALKADATEADAIAAVTALKATVDKKPAVPVALSAALGLQANADEAAAVNAVTALKGSDANLVQLVTQLQSQVTALSATHADAAVVAAVDDAIAAGKFLPATREQWIAFGRKDMTALKSMVAATPVIPGLAGQTNDKDPGTGGGGVTALSATQMQMCDRMGVDQAKYAERLKAEAKAA